MNADTQPAEERYMRAYFHTFTPTGDDKVDAILEAVAFAGKAYHCTDQWDEATERAPDGFWNLIQQRANEAATPQEAASGAVQVQEVALDAARYDYIRGRTYAAYSNPPQPIPALFLPTIPAVEGTNILRGSAAQHLDAAIDAAMKGLQ